MDTCEAGVEETGNSENLSVNSVKRRPPPKTNKQTAFGSRVKHSHTGRREYVQSGDCSYLHIYIQQTKPFKEM